MFAEFTYNVEVLMDAVILFTPVASTASRSVKAVRSTPKPENRIHTIQAPGIGKQNELQTCFTYIHLFTASITRNFFGLVVSNFGDARAYICIHTNNHSYSPAAISIARS